MSNDPNTVAGVVSQVQRLVSSAIERLGNGKAADTAIVKYDMYRKLTTAFDAMQKHAKLDMLEELAIDSDVKEAAIHAKASMTGAEFRAWNGMAHQVFVTIKKPATRLDHKAVMNYLRRDGRYTRAELEDIKNNHMTVNAPSVTFTIMDAGADFGIDDLPGTQEEASVL